MLLHSDSLTGILKPSVHTCCLNFMKLAEEAGGKQHSARSEEGSNDSMPHVQSTSSMIHALVGGKESQVASPRHDDEAVDEELAAMFGVCRSSSLFISRFM